MKRFFSYFSPYLVPGNLCKCKYTVKQIRPHISATAVKVCIFTSSSVKKNKKKKTSWLFKLSLLGWNMIIMTKKRKRKKSSLWSRGMSAQLCCQRQCRTDIQALAPPQRAQPHLCVRDPDDVIGPGDPVLGRGAGKAHTHTHLCPGSLLFQHGNVSAVYASQLTAVELLLLLAAPLCLHKLWKHLPQNHFPPSCVIFAACCCTNCKFVCLYSKWEKITKSSKLP